MGGEYCENSALSKAQAEYEAVEKRYIHSLEDKGLIFEDAAQSQKRKQHTNELRERLRKYGVVFRNAGASLSVGFLSPACVACTGDTGSETFSTTFKCHRDCYFCFNRNIADYDEFILNGCPWKEGLARCKRENNTLSCIGLTGGEPLIDLENALLFLERTAELFPQAHRRMYTSGDLLTEESARLLRDAGLDEIRFSVKDDDSPEMQKRVLDAMKIAKHYIPTVMVEMPVIPGSMDHMKDLFRHFNEIGIDGINLLEFCFPFCRWEEFEKRGFVLKNPPFDVMYDYSYSGGLAVAGSEELILELMLWALDEGVTFGMHYCSLDNKHRSEIRQKNTRGLNVHPCLEFDDQDFFLKTIKVFGEDRSSARDILTELGCVDMIEDAHEESLAFSPKYKDDLLASGFRGSCATCYYIYEISDGEDDAYLIDVALKDIRSA